MKDKVSLARPLFAGGAVYLFAEAVAEKMSRETDEAFAKAAAGAVAAYVLARQFTRPVASFAFALGAASALINIKSQLEKTS